jgi:hypothetical protein
MSSLIDILGSFTDRKYVLINFGTSATLIIRNNLVYLEGALHPWISLLEKRNEFNPTP